MEDMPLLVVVQSKHSVVVAATTKLTSLAQQPGKLTEDTLEAIPGRGVKCPGVVAGEEDKWSGKPVMVKHLPFGADERQVKPHRRSRLHLCKRVIDTKNAYLLMSPNPK